jgi:hypothetical protein
MASGSAWFISSPRSWEFAELPTPDMSTKNTTAAEMPVNHASVLTRKQVKTFRKDLIIEREPVVIIAEVRHDDKCNNGHNTFAITGEIYEAHRQPGEPTVKHANGETLWLNSCGCIHDEIAEHFPELAPFIKWHLTSTDAPMHYVANAVYHAGDRDCHGLRKGEKRQIINGRTGEPCWELVAIGDYGQEIPIYEIKKQVDGEKPTSVPRLEWRPWCRVGDGKERDFKAARSCAVWPDATDEQLSAEPEELKRMLIERVPALMAEFKRDVESLGFTY